MTTIEEKINVTAPGAREKFEAWLARGDAIAVFQNSDLGHPNLGHGIFMPMAPEIQEKATIGQTRGPDGSHGFGWRYLLVAVERSLDLFTFEPEPRRKS